MVWVLVPVAIVGYYNQCFYLLSHFGEHYAHIVKPIIACYTLYLGTNILKNAFKKKGGSSKTKRKTNLRILGLAGGFIDSLQVEAGDLW